MPKGRDTGFRPMRVQVRPGSYAESFYRTHSGLIGNALGRARAIVPGIASSPIDDLIFHGGRTIPKMQLANLFVGGEAAWKASDVESIDNAIFRAMNDRRLNNVMVQYFPGKKLDCAAKDSQFLPGTPPKVVSQGDAIAMLKQLYADGTLGHSDLDATIFNLLLPPGTVLTDSEKPHAGKRHERTPRRSASSLHGLGGYHGSLHIRKAGAKKITIYYSIDVYSQILPGRKENGIAVWKESWKNVVATLYHEINEFRTDPDVDDALAAGDDPRGNDFLGWVSRNGDEVGDYPIAIADPLTQVFRQVKLAGKTTSVPVQFQYSNFVHGPEGPLDQPHR
ncbi:MAG: hypothetical protein ABI886_14900 [Betaproteobacteria bacterium]